MVWLHSRLCQKDGTSPKPMMNLPLGFVREWDNPDSHGLIIIFSFKINIWYTICLEIPHIWSIAHHSFTLSVKRPLLRALGFWKGHSASRDWRYSGLTWISADSVGCWFQWIWLWVKHGETMSNMVSKKYLDPCACRDWWFQPMPDNINELGCFISCQVLNWLWKNAWNCQPTLIAN